MLEKKYTFLFLLFLITFKKFVSTQNLSNRPTLENTIKPSKFIQTIMEKKNTISKLTLVTTHT